MSDLKATIEQFRTMRESIRRTYEQRIAELRQEREQMNEQYDEEIGALDSELRALGIAANDHGLPNDVGVEAFNYLREHPQQRFSSSQLMAAIRSVGAVASVVLAAFVDDGRVQRDGCGRSTVYFVDQVETDD